MTQSTDNEQDIAAELDALGEAPPSADELGFVRGGAEARLDVDVRNTAALVGIGHPGEHADVDHELLPLARRRVWKVVADRGAPFLTAAAVSTRPGIVRAVVGALAVAAGVLLVPRLAPPSAPLTAQDVAARTAELEEAGAAARAAVDALPGPSGSERAQSMAKAYAARLSARRGGSR